MEQAFHTRHGQSDQEGAYVMATRKTQPTASGAHKVKRAVFPSGAKLSVRTADAAKLRQYTILEEIYACRTRREPTSSVIL